LNDTALINNDTADKSLCFIDTPVGQIGIAENGQAITDIFFARDGAAINGFSLSKSTFRVTETALLKKATSQLNEYFDGVRKAFDLPLAHRGTEFQKAVWEALREIPYGQVRSYKDIAERVGSQKAYRAVGMANNRNPIVIVIPCHRVIGHNGALVGFGGGIPSKEYLLRLEGASFADSGSPSDIS
jgi:methylated-DNA-[protein]-cysteine S-methyltransferase